MHLVEAADHRWRLEIPQVELPPDPPRVRHADIERVFQQHQHRQDLLCRIRTVTLEVEPATCLDTGRVVAFLRALRILKYRHWVAPTDLGLFLHVFTCFYYILVNSSHQ